LVVARLPEWVKNPLRRFRSTLRSIIFAGNSRRCPLCGKSASRFLEAGIVPRPDAKCPHCGSLERHRLLWLFLHSRTDLFDGRPKKMLCIAPEPWLDAQFKQSVGEGYLSADLLNPKAMVQMDITDIQFPDQTFDVVYCSHVFEHVPDDRKAMRETCRVLKKSGWAILLVPITSDKTFEDPTIVEPAARLKAFGQEDHVRKYGTDYVDRLRESGFQVTITRPGDLLSDADVEVMGLRINAGEIYYCTR
jgi:SAM-dependent methyltransferase